MTTDEQNNNISGNPSDETQPQPTVGAVEEVAGGQSRRKFLRLAVVSGATVATVGATAGIAAAHPHTGILTNLGVTNPFGASHSKPTCTVVLVGTELKGGCHLTSFKIDDKGHNQDPGQFYLFFTAQNVPQGTYTMKVAVTSTKIPASHYMVASPFTYHPGGGKNPNAFLYQLPKNTAQTDCMNFGGSLPSATKSGNTIQDLFSYTTTGTGNVDLQMAVHLDWDGTKISADDVINFNGELYAQGNDTPVCTAPFQVTAKPKS